MPECGDGADRSEKNRELFEFFKKLGLNDRHFAPGTEKFVSAERWLLMREIEKASQGRADLRFVSANEAIDDHAAASDEEFPPELAREFKGLRAEGPHVESVTPKRVGRGIHGVTRFGCDRSDAIVFEVPDANAPEVSGVETAHRNRSAGAIGVVMSGKNLKHEFEVGYGASHWADGSEGCERTDACRIVTCAGNSARCRLQGANAGGVCGLANRSTAVAAKSCGGHARRNRRRFSAAGTTGRVFEIPWIRSATVEEIVGLVGHQEFGIVGDAEDHGTGLAQAPNDLGISARKLAFVQQTAKLAAMAGHGDSGFNGDGESAQGAGERMAGRSSYALCIEIDQCVERGIQKLDATDVFFCEFKGRDIILAKQCKLLDGGTFNDGPAQFEFLLG